ncbi:unnamed protein product [Moneuplotes crassus]|uniref:Uncharacterized protein n=1 Tax=Euplotes crassus TaxID=5936 RepID=A0AAD1XG24_EUPCR|nr:unnamed protein product [Moneuplotes crassus]
MEIWSPYLQLLRLGASSMCACGVSICLHICGCWTPKEFLLRFDLMFIAILSKSLISSLRVFLFFGETSGWFSMLEATSCLSFFLKVNFRTLVLRSFCKGEFCIFEDNAGLVFTGEGVAASSSKKSDKFSSDSE